MYFTVNISKVHCVLNSSSENTQKQTQAGQKLNIAYLNKYHKSQLMPRLYKKKKTAMYEQRDKHRDKP